jgi:Holliday junction DNA helicase RuvA
MIAGLSGTVEQRGPDWVIIKVGGISFKVYAPTSTLSVLGPPGEEANLYTYLQAREDSLTLYGFASQEELQLFEALIGVAGVGPKVALAMLSAMKPELLALAIINSNIEFLTQVPGVGHKMASRLVLELKGKLEKGWKGIVVTQMPEADTEVVAALTSLGYSLAEANRAVAAMPNSSDLSLEDKVKLALQQFATK